MKKLLGMVFAGFCKPVTKPTGSRNFKNEIYLTRVVFANQMTQR